MLSLFYHAVVVHSLQLFITPWGLKKVASTANSLHQEILHHKLLQNHFMNERRKHFLHKVLHIMILRYWHSWHFLLFQSEMNFLFKHPCFIIKVKKTSLKKLKNLYLQENHINILDYKKKYYWKSLCKIK